MENFTPYSALAGGVLIGISASLLLLFNGRLAGISGIMGGLFGASSGDKAWRALFLIGMIVAGAAYQWLFPGSFQDRPNFPLPLLLIGGFIVGFGTRMGSGCTSGHGVCGIGRLSMRSIIATLVFMVSAAITVYIIRHIFGIV